jgi:class 3 adenylate cyclase
VALAARIVARAEGRKISSLDAVGQLMTGKGFVSADPGQMVLRGLEDPMRLYEARCEV